jgi:hypothetical protein
MFFAVSDGQHRQVFGLTGVLSTGRAFPRRRCLSGLRTTFVPVHRCGAVPDFHRIPSLAGGAEAAGPAPMPFDPITVRRFEMNKQGHSEL